MVITRRTFLGVAAFGGIMPPGARGERLIPQKPSARRIVDNDFAGDPDGLFALAHHLLTPKTRVALITTTALNPEFAAKDKPGVRTATQGGALAYALTKRMGIRHPPSIVAGPETFGPDPSDAARAIVAEAMRDDKLPLFLCCGGPLTNVAAALRLAPAIAARMTLIWIGGGNYPEGGWEYNLATDAPAARFVIEETRVPVWQIPQGAYRQMQYSIAEMRADFRPISPLTRWMYDQFTSPPDFVELGGAWSMGDSPPVLLTALSSESSRFTDMEARRIGADFRYGTVVPGRAVRVFESLDARLVFADFLALLRLHAKGL